MNFGNTAPTGFAFATPTPSATVNPLGSSTSSLFTSTPGMGVSTQPSLFGVTSTSSAPNLFGTATPGSSLFGGTNTTVSTGTTPSTGLFGNTTSRPIGFATTTSNTPSLFGTPTTSSFSLGVQNAFPSLGLGGTPASSVAATTAAPIGLGGVDFSQISGTKSSAAGKNDSKTIKEQVLPNEISESIDSFRKYVKDQKVIREEISRVSSKPIRKVQEQTASLQKLVSILSRDLQRNALAIERLKISSAKDLKNVEIAQRTKDLPPSMQFENTAPSEYFQDLVVDFEKQMQSCRQHIEQLEQYFAALAKPSILSPHELNIIIKRFHETFVALASQLHTIHESVKDQKDAFLNIRRSMTGDMTNIFERKKSDRPISKVSIPVTVGPPPFSSNPSAAAMAMAFNRAQQPGLTGSGAFGNQQSSFSVFGNSSIKPLGNFGSTSSFNSPSSTFGATDNKPFQLQKPPSGNKRGKRWTTN